MLWFISMLLTAGQLSMAAERWVPYQVIAEDELQLPDISVIGKRVLRNRGDWLIGKSEHFIVFTETRPELQNAIDEAENAYMRAAEWLNLDTEGMPISLLIFVRDLELWKKLMKGYGLRRDSLAMQIGRELYFKEVPVDERKPERISHEVIQLAMNLSFAPRVPLWLDEGIASHFGWICGVEMFNTREKRISRSQHVLDESELLELDELFAIRKYPVDPQEAQAFYRQSEELVAVLSEMLDRSDFARFVHIMCDGSAGSVDKFSKAAGLADGEPEAIVSKVRQRCTQLPGDSE